LELRVRRHRLRIAGKPPASLSTRGKEEESMKKPRLPKGWTEEKIRKLAKHHDNLTDDEEVAEIEAALNVENQTMVMVPTELVPEIVKLINKKRRA
jgi:O-phosphoseryl-tRNA(Cys) synthetase